MKGYTLIIILFLKIGLCLSCKTISKKELVKKQDLILEGKIIHNKTNEYSLNTDFVCSADAHIIMRINYVEMMDAPSVLVFEKDFKDIKTLPYHYKIYGKENEFYNQEGHGSYSISVEVINGAGNETYVGDLINEYSIQVYNKMLISPQGPAGPKKYLDIEVYGLEDCDAENSGGFCTSKHRN